MSSRSRLRTSRLDRHLDTYDGNDDYCCLCFRLQFGVTVLMVFDLVFAGLALLSGTRSLFQSHPEQETKGTDEYWDQSSRLTLIFSAVIFVACVVGLHGISKRNAGRLKLYRFRLWVGVLFVVTHAFLVIHHAGNHCVDAVDRFNERQAKLTNGEPLEGDEFDDAVKWCISNVTIGSIVSAVVIGSLIGYFAGAVARLEGVFHQEAADEQREGSYDEDPEGFEPLYGGGWRGRDRPVEMQTANIESLGDIIITTTAQGGTTALLTSSKTPTKA